MRYRVRMTDRAIEDADGILTWLIERDAADAAADWLERLMQKLDTLEERPDRCPLANEAVDLEIDLRELLLGTRRRAHRILFVIEDSTVHILRIWDAARRPLKPKDV